MSLDRVAQDQRWESGIPRHSSGRFESILRRGDDEVGDVAKSRIAGLWCLRSRAL